MSHPARKHARGGSSGSSNRRIRTGDRTMIACVHCKEKKQKCDEQTPACGSCQRLGIACFIEDPATKRRTPRNYLQSLEERVAMLEAMLQQQAGPSVSSEPILQDPVSGSDLNSAYHSMPVLDGPVAGYMPSIPVISTDNEEQDELSSKVGLLALNGPGTERDYVGSSSAFAFSRVIDASLRRLRSEGMSGDNPKRLHGLDTLPCPLPGPDICAMLSKAYFEHVHVQYPFLHRETFDIWEECLLNNLDLTSAQPIAGFFINMVYAVGALLVPQIVGCSPEGLYASAQLYMQDVLQLHSIESIQAILCCAMYSLRSPVGVSVWNLCGLALRHCIELGYHRSARKFGSKLTPLQVQVRKRVFWCAYGIDRAASMTLGRPFGIQDREIDVEYPLDIDDSFLQDPVDLTRARTSPTSPATPMSAAIHTFRLRHIWSKIHTTLYSSVPSLFTTHNAADSPQITYLRNELDSWRSQVPPRLTPPPSMLSVFASGGAWFDLVYQHSLLLLYRGHLTTAHEPLSPQSTAIFLESASTARAICLAYRQLYIGRHVSYTWGALHILFLAGLTYLHCLCASAAVRGAARQDEIAGTCTACTMVLVVMAERWEQAAPYRDIFEALAAKTMRTVGERERALWMLGASVGIADVAAQQVPAEMAGWMAQVADDWMGDDIESLLSGLVGELPSDGSTLWQQ